MQFSEWQSARDDRQKLAVERCQPFWSSDLGGFDVRFFMWIVYMEVKCDKGIHWCQSQLPTSSVRIKSCIVPLIWMASNWGKLESAFSYSLVTSTSSAEKRVCNAKFWIQHVFSAITKSPMVLYGECSLIKSNHLKWLQQVPICNAKQSVKKNTHAIYTSHLSVMRDNPRGFPHWRNGTCSNVLRKRKGIVYERSEWWRW